MKAKFNKGDTVRLVRIAEDSMKAKSQSLGRIAKIDGVDCVMSRVRYSLDFDFEFFWFEDEIELWNGLDVDELTRILEE